MGVSYALPAQNKRSREMIMIALVAAGENMVCYVINSFVMIGR